MKRSIVACAALLLALVVVAPAAGAVRSEDHARGGSSARVRVIDNAFRPGSITVSRGTRVRWVNRGSRTHTTTSNTSLWDQTLAPGASFTRRFGQRGTFRYHCTLHSTMHGTIRVT